MRKLKLEELGRPRLSEYKEIAKIPIVVILDDIRSAMNVGSFFRTCDAFKIRKIILCGITAQPPHREILKTAIGATDSVDWEYFTNVENVISIFKKENYDIIGVEQTTSSIPIDYFKVETMKKYALVFGNEVQGINQNLLPLLDAAIEIPQFGTKHSLNVAVCGGIILWNFSQPFLNENSKQL